MIRVRNHLHGREGLLLLGDLLCFVIFAVLGLRSHEEGITFGSFVRAAVPFQAGWVFASFALGKSGVAATDARQVARLWVPAWAIGLVLRVAFFDHSFAPAFAVVSLLFNGVLLMVWRSVLAPLFLRSGR